jgi:hypothetical protein
MFGKSKRKLNRTLQNQEFGMRVSGNNTYDKISPFRFGIVYYGLYYMYLKTNMTSGAPGSVSLLIPARTVQYSWSVRGLPGEKNLVYSATMSA